MKLPTEARVKAGPFQESERVTSMLVLPEDMSDFVPVTGGVPLADDYLQDGLDSLPDLKVQCDLDRHIVRLLALHKDLPVRFRNQDLARLDDDTKQALLQDINDLLGIKSLRTGKK